MRLRCAGCKKKLWKYDKVGQGVEIHERGRKKEN
jgi:hypothetical protein